MDQAGKQVFQVSWGSWEKCTLSPSLSAYTPPQSGAWAPEVPEERGLGGCCPASVQASGQRGRRSPGGKHMLWAVGAQIPAPEPTRLEVAGGVLMVTSLETQLTDWPSASEERQHMVMVGENRAERRKVRPAFERP